ncbi:MAG TPA: ABC transporter permease [Blastocatellia bacterium]|nr:ABC transporter permease [Blastocatellia bacterium]
MENLLSDFRYGFRTLLKNPAFSIVAILAIMLGTGANSAIFSVVNAILLRPLAFNEPDRLVMVWGNNVKSGVPTYPLSVLDFLDYREQNQVFEQLASFAYDDFNLSTGEEPEHYPGSFVSANFFSLLGVNPTVGRAFAPEEDQAGAERVVILSNGLWKRRFGADPNLVGQTIQLNGASFTVVGVMPSNFRSPNAQDNPQIWVPMSFDGGDPFRIPASAGGSEFKNRTHRFLIGVARLKPGVTISQAQADMETVARQIEQQYPDINTGLSVNVVSLHKQVIGNIKPALLVLLVAVGSVLLIACANVANLLLARAAGRQKEFAIRAALGAGRLRLIRQLLTESLLLALIGGALGLLLAFAGIKLLLSLNPPNIPRLGEISVDGRVLGFTLLVSILTGVVFGLVPALQASRPDLNETLKEGSRGSTGGRGRQQVRGLIVISEIVVTTVLLIIAGLMIKSFWSLQNVNPGFNPANTLTMMVNLAPAKYSETHQVRDFYDLLLKRIETLPGVQSVGAVTNLPLTSTVVRFRFTIDGRPPATPGERLVATTGAVNSNYFHAIGIPLLKGRYFTEQDRDKSPPVIIINDTMARRHWPGEDPIGRRITLPSLGGISREIVGVVGDIKHSGLDTESGAQMYLPYPQQPWNFMSLVVRAQSDPTKMAGAVRHEITALDTNQSAYDVKTMQQVVSESVSQPRLYTLLLGVFAAVAMILAAVGTYGVMNYLVTQRIHEIGIRMALGAQASHIFKMIIGQGMLLVLIGVVVGLVAAFLLTRVMESLLFGVSARDLATFMGIPIVLAVVAFLSIYIPARRAMRVNPMVALRQE